VRKLSNTEPAAKIYELLLQLFSEKDWFPPIKIHFLHYGDTARKIRVLRQLGDVIAGTLHAIIKELIKSDDATYFHYSFLADSYSSAFGMHVSFRIRGRWLQYGYEIFEILGRDAFHNFVGWAKWLPQEDATRVAELFGRSLRLMYLHGVDRINPEREWIAFRRLMAKLPSGRSCEWLLGKEKADQLQNWVVRARQVAPESTAATLEELQEEIEKLSNKPPDIALLADSIIRKFFALDPTGPLQIEHSGNIFFYLSYILLQERLERDHGGFSVSKENEWEGFELLWKLGAIWRYLGGIFT
jgi:hypothetical protein